MIDIERVRADTPGCESVIHFNNAGSSLHPAQVVDAVVDYLWLEQRMGGYETQDMEAARLDGIYGSAARFLNCRPEEVAFTVNGTDGWWRAFSSIPLAASDRVLIGHSEFQLNAYGLLQAVDRGVVVDVVPNDDMGEIDLDALDEILDERVKAISLTHVSMSNGAVHPAAEVGRRAREAGVVYLLDACQSAGQLPLDVEELGCDFLVLTGRKFVRGPRGTGILFARDAVIDRLGPSPFLDGRAAEWTGPTTYEHQPHARRFEFQETSYAGRISLGEALEYAMDIGLDSIEQRVQDLSAQLRSALADLGIVVVHDEGRRQCGIVTFTVAGVDPAAVQSRLTERSINVSAPRKSNAMLDLGSRGIDAVVRAGVHYYNTEDEVDRFRAAVAQIAAEGSAD